MSFTLTEWEERLPARDRDDYLLLLAALAEYDRVEAEKAKNTRR